MSLHIYIAHTGEHLLANPVSFASPDALRSWIARNTSIASQRQILMTARGKNVKLQTLATEDEIFVYDRQLVSDAGSVELPDLPQPPPFKPKNPPDTLTDQNDLQSWRNLYMARRTWALALAEECVPVNQALQEHNERIDIIYRGVGVALENLKSHVASLENRFQEAQTWADDLLKEQRSALEGWQTALDKLKAIPARKDITFLGRPSTPKKETKNRSSGTLQDFLDVDEVRRAASRGTTVSQSFSRRVDDVQAAVRSISSDTQALLQQAQPPIIDGSHGLLEEVETLAKKVSSDYEHVLSLPSNQKSLANISRMALGHTKELLPSLREISLELHTALNQAVQHRIAAMKAAVNHMRTVSSLESRLADVQAQIAKLDVDADVFDIVFEVYHLPVAYGSVLVEAVRRREWSEKLKSDSLTLAEEIAVFRDEEQRRRKKWAKSMGELLVLPDDVTPGLEINMQGQGQDWPEVHRKEIEVYIDTLKAQNDMTSIVEEVSQLYADLDKPTRQQKRRAKAFKHGSVIDMGRSSLLIRGDDMVRSLQDEKFKLEEKVKTSESRIRKLEDLLHRQSHIARPLSGNFSTDFPMSPASPRPDTLSRRSSVSSRRMSSNQTAEDKALVQRIVGLEADLATERETVQRLQKEARMERQSSTDRMQEVQSTKEDLIKNLESRRREFEDERKFLEADAKQLRHRIEELEEELFNVLDRRDHETKELEERSQKLEEQLIAAETRTTKELENAQTELQALQDKFSREKHRASELESAISADKERLSNQEAKISELQVQLETLHSQNRENLNTLQAAHAILSPERSAPSDFASLVKAIEILAEGLTIHARNTEQSHASLLQEKKDLEEKLDLQQLEVDGLRGTIDTHRAEMAKVQNELLQEQSQVSVLKSELADERSQLHHLRTKFSAGETGSEVLRERLAEEEGKVASMSQKLIQLNAQAHTAEEEAREFREKLELAQESEKQLTAMLNARGNKAQEVSQRLLAQAEGIGRMLEQLGFAIVLKDDQLIVQRASKVNSASASGELLASSTVASLRPDPTLSTWIQDKADEEDAKFKEFMDSMAKFDVEVFGESVVKREKDIEVLARKWQKEARGYRDKYHRMQSEAHEKIAYRSFKEGDLALFLPTRNQAIRSWAAFNVGAPHYFLREQDVHKLSTRDWLLARIGKIEERVVDLSKSMNGGNQDRRSITSDGTSFDDENPFELSDGLRWYLLDATEEKPGAPSTPGLGKSTVASAPIDAKGSIRLKRSAAGGNVAKTLTKSLDSRRNSSASKKGAPVPTLAAAESIGDNVQPADADTGLQPREFDPIFDEASEQLQGIPSRSPTVRPGLDDLHSSASSPNKRPSRLRPWEKIWSLDYRVEGHRQ
ncbi:Taz1-interacting factor 1 (TAF1), putative [Talaromyces stipitatus ATCC 10500]|uniref:Autophagy-related protein 11 n=1 Tax=Talaromyces stipitatus (strain ATCC 10500 / CBS 375.48 / QM 6759 / NRRL 1006) TaxID=441959 RepID=B8M4Y7_TALSN|nr:Taz1-interacting factor 1 (TAF1), putative [Talaromyces stipitatus ATCC 10500]EED19422.1 Taz1-interacting factor 1 (TAF1), putative [Talaromyces stipitatus ATCC 10500]